MNVTLTLNAARIQRLIFDEAATTGFTFKDGRVECLAKDCNVTLKAACTLLALGGDEVIAEFRNGEILTLIHDHVTSLGYLYEPPLEILPFEPLTEDGASSLFEVKVWGIALAKNDSQP